MTNWEEVKGIERSLLPAASWSFMPIHKPKRCYRCASKITRNSRTKEKKCPRCGPLPSMKLTLLKIDFDKFHSVIDKMRYKHYKGGEYIVLGTGKMESSGEEMVIYRQADSIGLWIRPAKEFHGTVSHEMSIVKRFKLINGEQV